jgi:hypothetical protein
MAAKLAIAMRGFAKKNNEGVIIILVKSMNEYSKGTRRNDREIIQTLFLIVQNHINE